MNYTTENHGNETIWYPEYARVEVMTQAGPDLVIAKRVQGGWASWMDFFPDESVLHFEAAHILTPAELQAERAKAVAKVAELVADPYYKVIRTDAIRAAIAVSMGAGA